MLFRTKFRYLEKIQNISQISNSEQNPLHLYLDSKPQI